MYAVELVAVNWGGSAIENIVVGPLGPSEVVSAAPERDAEGVIEALLDEVSDALEEVDVVSADADAGDAEELEESVVSG